MRGAAAMGAAVGILLGGGCGPAPYTIGPEEPPAVAVDEAPPATVFIAPVPPAAPEARLEVRAAPRREPEDRWIPDGFPRPNPFTDHRTWIGTYDCAQGRTNLTLRVVDTRGKRVRAIFDFHHAPSDTAGQYLMAGSFDDQTGAVTLIPGPWIIHPASYVSVPMTGQVTEDGLRFRGSIPFPGCGAFQLHAAR